MTTENSDLKAQIEETMSFLGISEFDQLDHSLSNLSPEGFFEFVQQRTSHLPEDQKTRVINFLASRKSYLDFLKDGG